MDRRPEFELYDVQDDPNSLNNLVKSNNHQIIMQSLKKADGTEIFANRLERPFIYVENGVAKVLTVAVLEENQNSYSLFIPLQ
jgi:hypothetical protein